jgi:hypothetical protein
MGIGSEIRYQEKTYSGSRGQKGTGCLIKIRITDTDLVSLHTFLLGALPRNMLLQEEAV